LSVQSAKHFLERLAADERLRTKIVDAEDGSARIGIAKEEGFVFTKDEIQQARDLLDDHDLDGISGGMSNGSVIKLSGDTAFTIDSLFLAQGAENVFS